jgi:hypothetical protein
MKSPELRKERLVGALQSAGFSLHFRNGYWWVLNDRGFRGIDNEGLIFQYVTHGVGKAASIVEKFAQLAEERQQQ